MDDAGMLPKVAILLITHLDGDEAGDASIWH